MPTKFEELAQNIKIEELIKQFKTIGIIDVIDILIVAALFYLVYSFIRERRAGKLTVGIILLIAVWGISTLVGLSATAFILEGILSAGLVALVVVFQPELRAALEKVGSEPVKSIKKVSDIKGADKEKMNGVIREIASACADMSASKTGALIILERTTNLDNVVKGGKDVNADVTSNLLKNLFYKGAPLHDGAVVIRDCRIYQAGCILPLSSNESVARNLGTRHHAALGISEESDAVTVVVSEETGTVSLAIDGKIERNLDSRELVKRLQGIFETNSERKKKVKNAKTEGRDEQ